jgi:transposase
MQKTDAMAEMARTIETLLEENKALKNLVASLTAKVAELEARLNKNSKNSNKPPSSDGPRKKIRKSRVKSDRPSGGQPGHPGITMDLKPSADTVVNLMPSSKCECGGEIIIRFDGFAVRQVTDIEPAKVVTVEYRAHDGICGNCGKPQNASFPEGVAGTASYGGNIQAILAYLNAYQLLPLKRTTELMRDLFGANISQGTVVNSMNEAYESLAGTESRIKEEIIRSDVVHYDESGMRVCGANHWLHVAGTKTGTVYSIHAKRGKDAMDDMGILPRFRGTAIHDHWKSYFRYGLCSHGECNQHILRELAYIFEDLGQDWAGEMICLLLRIKRHIDLTKLFNESETGLAQEETEIYANLYREILSCGEGGKAQAPVGARRMLKRLAKYEDETLLFMYDFDVPFTNNLAERDIRMPKAKQKISGGFRSEDGANAFARVRGFVSTLRKRGKSIYDGLVAVFKGEAEAFLFPVHVQDST